jgi:hypothetical protein
MQAATQVFLSGALTFGVPLAWAVHELIVLRRSPGGFWRGHKPPPPEPPGSPPERPKQLPACLIPKLRPAVVRPRVRETV